MKNKFQYIYKQLIASIEEGRFQTGETLPSENELARTYDASRETIRKALKMLSEHGYIQKVQGKGSIVLDLSRIDFPFSGVTSFKELGKKLGTRAQTDVVHFSRTLAGETIANHLQLEAGEPVWTVHRVRQIDGERIILDKDTFCEAAVPGLTREISENSIYEYVEEVLGLSISFAKKEIVIEEPIAEDERYLDLDGATNIVVVRSYAYLEDATLFQYTESRHRPDKFRFVDFARRVKP
ncbi:trehalose operon repressor [Shouchella shacheensis]|uniref:trehalose operon repressor n=1 Tax=Shouchella shacheensis TaxID=1649580 RepID=UPI0009EB4FD8|nr:trehalose operon repressor [Shouchella shacheensis]